MNARFSKKFILMVAMLVIGQGRADGQRPRIGYECEKNRHGYAIAIGRVGGKDLRFLIDSGSSHNVIFRATLQSIDEFKNVYIGELDGMSVVNKLSVSVSGLTDSSDLPWIVLDTPLTEDIGSIDGILGVPFLKDKVLRFGGRTLRISNDPVHRFVRLPGILCEKDEYGRVRIPLNAVFVSPCVKDTALLDTGSNVGLTISEDVYNDLRQLGEVSARQQGEAVFKFEDRVELQSARFLPIVVDRAVMSMRVAHKLPIFQAHVDIDDDSAVGVPVLWAREVVVDFSSSEVWVGLP